MILRYCNVNGKKGIPPTKDYPHNAGWDLYSIEPRSLMPGERHRFNIGLQLAFTPTVSQLDWFEKIGMSWYGRLADKSGLADKHGIHILGGVVDRGFTGEVGIVLANLGFMRDGVLIQLPWSVAPGDPLCQIVPEVILDCRTAMVLPEGLPITDRGERGFTSG